MPFVGHCGIEIRSASPDEVVGTIPWRVDLCTAGGLLHGGAIMTLGDSLGAVCAFLNVPAGGTTSTLESKTNMFRPHTQGLLIGTATPLHVGRTTIVVQTDIRNEEGKRVALVTQTQAVVAKS